MPLQLKSKYPRLERIFFERNTLSVAKNLLGQMLIYNNFAGIITETEAYIGETDPACHAARGKTKRTEVMYGPAGLSYIYLIYGMYHCLNFVTEKKDFPAAVLIRGLYLLEPKIHLDGPGKLCRKIGLDLKSNKKDLTQDKEFYLLKTNLNFNFETTSRIGISKGQDKEWRFLAQKNELETKINSFLKLHKVKL